MVPRLLEKYRKEIVARVMQKFSLKNRLQVPRLEKIVINMGVGEGAHDAKIIEEAAKQLSLIAGQKPLITKARKAISNFKIRKGAAVGAKVTLRGYRMYEFMDRLVNAALPRIRDFRGFSTKSFDAMGNYSFGLTEQNIFPELEVDLIQRQQGMDITIVTRAKSRELAITLLREFGFPFR